MSTPAEAAAFLPYTGDSFFRSRVETLPIDGSRTSAFRTFMANHPDQGRKGITWPKLNLNPSWAMTTHVHRAGTDEPVWRLTGGNTGHAKLRHLTTQGFHMPDSLAALFPSGKQDRPGVIVDTEFGYTVQFADAQPNVSNRTIQVSNAACFWHSSNGLDYRNPLSTDARNFSSRGRIIDAMTIRPDLLAAAIAAGTGLGHVLHLYFVQTNKSDGFCHPMTGTESKVGGFGAEGERVRLRPDINLATVPGLTGGPLVVARTLQQHGAYIGDNSGSATQIKCANPAQYPYTAGMTVDALKGKISWNDFEVVVRGAQ